jgi:competence protein ComEC
LDYPSAKTLEQLVQKIPFLRITIALAVGIITGLYISIPFWLLALVILLLLLSIFFLNKNYKFQFTAFFGIGAHLTFVLLGLAIYQEYNRKPVFYKNGAFVATVMETPVAKPNSYKSKIKITAFLRNDSVYNTSENVIAYFSNKDDFKTPKAGDQIIFNQTPEFVKNHNNPYEFDYKNYLERKKIYRQVYLNNESWRKTNEEPDISILIIAENLREELLGIYKSQNLDNKEFEILSALTLGYKRELDRETKRVFSAAGAMHVLAVSGLHVGIVVWFISLLFGFLKKQKNGRILFITISLGTIWVYTFITGLSPSVLRAATMFTIYIIGDNLKRPVNFYNSLAASAFLILLFNPNNLFEVGFQLSYSAVFGIVYLQPRLARFVQVKQKIPKFFIDLLTVSVAAQIATFPWSLFYFNQFPTYFWITNLFIIPVAMALIPLGFALLLFAKINVVSSLISAVIGTIIKTTYDGLNFMEQLPGSTLETGIDKIQLLLVVILLISAVIYLEYLKVSHLKVALSCVFLIFVHGTIKKMQNLNRKEIIVYNSAEHSLIQLISADSNYIFSNDTINEKDYSNQFIKNTTLHLKLNEPEYYTFNDSVKSENIFYKNGLLFFEGKTILVNPKNITYPDNETPTFVINPTFDSNTEINANSSTCIIITDNRHGPKAENIHFTKTQGAFRKKW